MSDANTSLARPADKKPRPGKAKRVPGPGADLTLISVMERFQTPQDARGYLERLLWPHGPYCPHCGNADEARIAKIEATPGTKIREGLYRCNECGQQFTVTVNTIFEDSHIPLHKWVIAFYMMCASKTQISALQLQRQLEIGSYKTAWFMCHRIRFALQDHTPQPKLDGVVEADETWIGGKVRGKGRAYKGNKTPVVALVERGGRVRSAVVQSVNSPVLEKMLREHVETSAVLNTDESNIYAGIGQEFAAHDTVNHSQEEYSRNDAATGRKATTNTIEGFFGNVKRSIDGTHHSISPQHTPLYLAEFDHKYNTRKITDGERTVIGLGKVEGKRLTLRPVKPSSEQMPEATPHALPPAPDKDR